MHKKILLTFKEIKDRYEAEALKGCFKYSPAGCHQT